MYVNVRCYSIHLYPMGSAMCHMCHWNICGDWLAAFSSLKKVGYTGKGWKTHLVFFSTSKTSMISQVKLSQKEGTPPEMVQGICQSRGHQEDRAQTMQDFLKANQLKILDFKFSLKTTMQILDNNLLLPTKKHHLHISTKNRSLNKTGTHLFFSHHLLRYFPRHPAFFRLANWQWKVCFTHLL